MPAVNYQELGNGISCIDTGYYRKELAACYLIVEGEMAGFVETGVNDTVPLLLAILQEKNIPRENVAYVMPTHVHLDHAGGAGLLMQKLPNASLVMHPRAARHMIDPTKLQAGSMAVYGEEAFNRMYGQLVPVPKQRVLIAEDGFELDFNGRPLRFLDTPGHARHHYCIYDKKSEGFFAGDTFGVCYQELIREGDGEPRFIFPPSTPVQFDPQAWHSSLDKLMALRAKRVYLTHYSMLENLHQLEPQLRALIDRYVVIAETYRDSSNRQEKIKQALEDLYINLLTQKNCPLPVAEQKRVLGMDINLNAQGLDIWLDSQVKAQS